MKTKTISISVQAGSDMQSETFDDFLGAILQVWETRHKKNLVGYNIGKWTDSKKKNIQNKKLRGNRPNLIITDDLLIHGDEHNTMKLYTSQ